MQELGGEVRIQSVPGNGRKRSSVHFIHTILTLMMQDFAHFDFALANIAYLSEREYESK